MKCGIWPETARSISRGIPRERPYQLYTLQQATPFVIMLTAELFMTTDKSENFGDTFGIFLFRNTDNSLPRPSPSRRPSTRTNDSQHFRVPILHRPRH